MDQIEQLIKRYPALSPCRDEIEKAIRQIIRAFERGGTLLVCGNGGSCADAEHIAGELMKGFRKRRPLSPEQKQKLAQVDKALGDCLAESLQQPLRTVSLMGAPALTTAFSNDVNPAFACAQQALAFADENSVFLGISTSGNAQNVLAAAVTAKAMGTPAIGLTGADGGKMNGLFDILIKVPETETYKIQELHLPVYHCVCAAVEEHFFSE